MTVLAIGTSHTADTNGYTEELSKYYSDGTDRWTDIIGAVNLGIPQCGIDTYFPRILAALKKYPEAKLVLIEIPTGYRAEYPVEVIPRVNPEHLTEHEFWFREKGKYNIVDYKPYINSYLRMGNLDWKLNNLKEKMDKVNDYADIGISEKEYITLSMIMNKWDYNILVKQMMVKIKFIHLALNNLGYQNVFWHMDPDPQNLITTEDVPLINKQSVIDYFNYDKTNRSYFYDRAHLNKIHWEQVVQEYFRNEIQRLTGK